MTGFPCVVSPFAPGTRLRVFGIGRSSQILEQVGDLITTRFRSQQFDRLAPVECHLLGFQPSPSLGRTAAALGAQKCDLNPPCPYVSLRCPRYAEVDGPYLPHQGRSEDVDSCKRRRRLGVMLRFWGVWFFGAGLIMLIGCCVLMVIGVFWMRKTVQIEV